MRGFLTFTLAAGVAITTTSVVHAAGVGKGAMNGDRSTSNQVQAPMSLGAMGGLTLDRSALNRELGRLRTLLEPLVSDDESESGNTPVQTKTSVGAWTF